MKSINRIQVAQVTAADPKSSVWVSANAGTGKTQVLIDRITRLLLNGVKPERILCLTFTKAAAAEMAARLSDRLSRWTKVNDKTLNNEISAFLGKPPQETMLAPARRLFAKTLDVPGGLKIRTIHAFCESLLGRFPIEAGIAPHFSVIDERTSTELMNEARDHLFFQAQQSNSGDLVNALTQMAELLNEEGFNDLMNDLSSQRTRLRSLLMRHGNIDAVIDASREALGIEKEETAQSILAQACDNSSFDKDGMLVATEALLGGTPHEKIKAKKLQKWLESDVITRATTFDDVYKIFFLTKDNEPRKKLITKKIAEANPNVSQALVDEQQRILAVEDRLRCVGIFLASQSLIKLGYQLLDTFEQLKQERSLLDYDDLILKARDLLQAEGGASWVHYKLDGGLDHILVDEAQDTSSEQWDVIKALAGDFFKGYGARETERTVFAVGDEKQSIYSFQGADPFMFGHTSEHFSREALYAKKAFETVELEKSYRSTASILKTVDKVFERGPAREGLTFDEKPIIHEWERQGQAGLVELWPTIKKGEAIEVKPWDAPLDRLPVDSPEDRMARRIAETIKGWLEKGEELLSAGRPIREGDIMILVRQRGSFAEKMVNTLKQYDIPVAGADRMVLTEQLAVMDLMALGRFVLLPEDDLTLAVVLKGPLFGFTDNEDLFPLAYKRDNTLWATLKEVSEENPKFLKAHQRLAKLLARADYMPPYEFYAKLLGPEGGRKDLIARLGQEADDPIDEFLSLALDFEREHVPSLQGFLNWIEARRTQIKRDLEQGRGDVRVMTIHGSKGLQGNVIFLPDTCSVPTARYESKLRWIYDPKPALLWEYSKDQRNCLTSALAKRIKLLRAQEYRRLLYVAMTRARDRLYIGGWEGKNEPSEDCWYKLIEPAFREISREVQTSTGESVLRLSNPQEEKPDSKDDSPSRRMGEVRSPPDWALKQAPSEPDSAPPLSPSKFKEDEPGVRSPFNDNNRSHFKRGTIVHRLLESLPNLHPKQRTRATFEYLARTIHCLDKHQQISIAKEVLSVMQNPEFQTLFSPESFAEVPVNGVVNGHVVSGKIDRLSISNKKITIIDYKTNRSPPSKAESVSPLYLRQMAFYRSLLREVYPEQKVVCILAWTDTISLMTLPDELLDQYTA